MLYELLTGSRPFQGKDPASVIASILKDEPSAIPSGAVLPKPLDRVLSKCLAKDPERRWQSAADMRDELQWIAAGGAPNAAAMAGASKTRWGWMPWVVVALFAGLAIAAFFVGRGQTTENQRVVRFPLILPEDASLDLEVSPDGEKVAFVRGTGSASSLVLQSGIRGDLAGPQCSQLHLVSLAAGQPRLSDQVRQIGAEDRLFRRTGGEAS